MNILTLEQLESEQVTPVRNVKNRRKVICIVNGSIFEKPIFDTESYYYFTEVWKYRPFS
jgi:hypothetical protein